MIDIITTGDGSHSLLHSELNETYHSTHGAVQESQYVFIERGLNYFADKQQKEIGILEIGFGTGLNAMLTLREALAKQLMIRYETFEKFPLDEELVNRLNYPQVLDWPEAKEWFSKLHESPWDREVRLHPLFTLKKRHEDITSLPRMEEKSFDLVYFDAFAPNRQPEMWSEAIFSTIVQAMKQGGVVVSYCAQGQFKRNLRDLGLSVEALPGPPGKREMVRATLL